MTAIVQFFALLMDACHHLVPNHWADIVLFTFLTKILQYPVSLWCQANSLKMVSLLPRTIRLKLDHYGDNDTIGEKTAELYKQEGYHPLLSLVPLAIQIVILIAFVRVIGDVASAPGAGAVGLVPATDGGLAWLMPLAAGASAWLLGLSQNRINPLQREQSRAAQWTTNGISIAISRFLGAFVGLGVGLYWVCSNLFSILVQLACNWNMPPAKRVDYPALRAAQAELTKFEAGLRASAAVSPEDKKREKRDWKRFFSVANKHIVFYAEGGGYYRYLQSVVEWLLDHSNATIHYVTNDPKDAVFALAESRPKLRAYYIGPVRIIPLMMKMDADIVVMTTPDLGTYQLKRSYVRKDVQYVYLDHAPASVHMTYRKGAFDHFDTLFANGPAQAAEARATEKLYSLKPKNIVETGYPLLDTLLANPPPPAAGGPARIMVAPSYQDGNIFDSCLDAIVDAIAAPGRTVVLRPHPQYVRRHPAKMHAIEARYAGRPGIEIESDFGKPSTMDRASVLVTDWSGIAYEYAFQTKRPVLFVDTPMKVVNPEWERLGLVPTEISFRNRVGVSVAPSDIPAKAPATVADMLAHPGTFADRIDALLREQFYNPGRAAEAAGRYILQSLIARKQKKGN
jgi:YidC/Oxa1 family membrane protein insertase